MCKMVFDTLSKSSITISSLGKADRVTFEYYQARYELHNFHFRQARELLLRCFDSCHVNAHQQKRLIFIYLVAASLPLGIFPSQSLLSAFSLQHIFSPIIQSVKEGNFELLAKAFYSDSRTWLLHMGIWVPLKERVETLVWRVFIRKV